MPDQLLDNRHLSYVFPACSKKKKKKKESDCRNVEDKLIGESGVRKLRGQVVGRVIFMNIEVTKGYV